MAPPLPDNTEPFDPGDITFPDVAGDTVIDGFWDAISVPFPDPANPLGLANPFTVTFGDD